MNSTTNAFNKKNTLNLKNLKNNNFLINKKILVTVSNGSIYEINLSAKNMNKNRNNYNNNKKKAHLFSQ
jgi:hypothetical protein